MKIIPVRKILCGEKKRKRERERERERERDRDRDRERETHTETETERDRERQTKEKRKRLTKRKKFSDFLDASLIALTSQKMKTDKIKEIETIPCSYFCFSQSYQILKRQHHNRQVVSGFFFSHDILLQCLIKSELCQCFLR